MHVIQYQRLTRWLGIPSSQYISQSDFLLNVISCIIVCQIETI
jgi:hypothetical protein